jgi:hypothetical protein
VGDRERGQGVVEGKTVMYAHQVIEALKNRLKKPYDEPYRQFLLQVLPMFKVATSFHLGEADKLPVKSLGGYVPLDTEQQSYTPIMYENLSDTRLPYKVCWIDWIETNIDPAQSMSVTSLKAGCLVFFRPETPDVMLIYCVQCHPVKGWQILPVVASVTINLDFSMDGQEMWLSDFYTDYKWPKTDLLRLKITIAQVVSTFHVFLLLMSCKNISTEVIKAPEALNKKRRKNGKQEIFDYHVLNVVVPSKKQGYRESTEPLSHVRIHLCRGHFKEYTADHPLFGKLTGRYWWQPHVRGQNKDGIVMKDYAIKTKEAT